MSTGTDSAAGEGLPSRRDWSTTDPDRHDQVARPTVHCGFQGTFPNAGVLGCYVIGGSGLAWRSAGQNVVVVPGTWFRPPRPGVQYCVDESVRTRGHHWG